MACGGVVGKITVVFRSRLHTRYSLLHTMLRGYSPGSIRHLYLAQQITTCPGRSTVFSQVFINHIT